MQNSLFSNQILQIIDHSDFIKLATQAGCYIILHPIPFLFEKNWEVKWKARGGTDNDDISGKKGKKKWLKESIFRESKGRSDSSGRNATFVLLIEVSFCPFTTCTKI